MHKTDCEINTWVASWMVGNYDWITDATADCEENYDIDDIIFSASTSSGHIIPKQMEVKSLKSGVLKKDGEWSNYFYTNNPDGITKKMMFGNVPPPDMDILDVPMHWKPNSFVPERQDMPENWNDKHIYILNAEDMYHRIHNSKTYKVFDKNASLCYVATDGLVFFSPTMLRKAFLGYVWYLNKSHTEEYNKKYCPVWELKAVFDLEKGSYHSATPPKELFNKKYTY